jgi:MFS transporter, DHA3 family, macrolide efflux protein
MKTNRPAGMRAFTIVWAGQFVSLLGTSMTQFALTIWSWKFVTEIQPVDNPATAMALVGFFNFAPAVIFSPVAGALVDRWNRKLTMMLVDLAAGLATISIFLLYTSGNLQIWHLYVAGAFTGLFQAFQFPAYSSAISMMVPKEQYTRADAMMGLVESFSTVFAPVIAGVLLGIIGIAGVMTIDIVTFLAALGTLAFVFIPQPPPSEGHAEGKGSLLHESIYGFRYIFARPSLFGLQMTFFFGNLLASMTFALFAPMILSRTANSEITLAIVQGALGVGGVLAGIILATWGGLKRRVYGVIFGWMLSGLLGSLILGLGRGLVVWVIGAFFSSFFSPVINASNQSIWQSKVPPDLQGRVFGVRRLIAQIVGPLGIVLAGPLADRVFEPALHEGGSLVGTFGWLVGTGPGAGMALLMIFASLGIAVVALVAYSIPAIRHAEDILPDHDVKAAETPPEEVLPDVPPGVSPVEI